MTQEQLQTHVLVVLSSYKIDQISFGLNCGYR